jgi:hypothetical protein
MEKAVESALLEFDGGSQDAGVDENSATEDSSGDFFSDFKELDTPGASLRRYSSCTI